jgi:hypothetical protein
MNHPLPTEHLLLRGILVKGQFFLPDEEKAAAKRIAVGQDLILVHEPTNVVDPAAVAASWWETNPLHTMRCGFVQKEVTPVLVLFLNNGYKLRAVVTSVEAKGNLAIDVFGAMPS